MQITLAAVCDYASITVEQKLNVLGVFDTIWAPSFPCAHPTMFLVLRTQVDHADRNSKHEYHVRLEDEDGKRLFEGTAGGAVGDVPPGETVSGNLILQLNGVRFPRPGRYSFVIAVGNEERHRLPLRVHQAPAQPAAGTA